MKKHTQKWLPSILTLASLVLCSATQAAPNTPPNRVPVQAELLKAIEAGRVKPGDSLLARVDAEWKSADCILRKGASLKSRIVAQSVVRRNAARQGQERLQPGSFRLAVGLDLIPALGPAQHRGNRDEQNLFQQVFFGTFHPRIG